MTTLLAALLWVLFPLLLVIVFLERLTESRQQQIRRLYRQGCSQRVIAERLGITRYRVRLALA
jgi:DNA-binding NarL/FixJ family response regulator